MAHHYGNLLQKHPCYSDRGTLRLQEQKRQRERGREEGRGEGEREKQIEEVEQEGVRGGGRRKRGDR